MKKILYRIIGILLIAAAIGGLIFSLIAMYVVWKVKTPVSEGISSSVGLLTSTLDTTVEGLLLSQQALETSTQSLEALQSTLVATGNAIAASEPFIENVGVLMKDQLPTTIEATQSSLEGVQKSTRLIDSVLKALTIFNRGAYQPDQPLHEAIADVSISLGEIPATMIEMEESLSEATGNLDVIQKDLIFMADSVGEIDKSINEFNYVIEQYIELINGLKLQLENLETNFPTYWNWLASGVTIFLIWMAIAQLGLLTQGLELFRREVNPEDRSESGSDEVENLAESN